MPSNIQLSGYEASLVNEYGREAMLKQYIDVVRMNYDYIIIDCQPSLNILTVMRLPQRIRFSSQHNPSISLLPACRCSFRQSVKYSER